MTAARCWNEVARKDTVSSQEDGRNGSVTLLANSCRFKLHQSCVHLAQVSSSSRNSFGPSSMDSITFAAMLVEPDEEFVLKKEGSILAAAGRLSMKGDMSTPMSGR